MDLFTEMAKHPIFSLEDVIKFTTNKNTAYSMVNRLQKKGRIIKIRNNIYSVVNPMTGELVANRFQIGCALSDTAFISHHSAFEYYGLTNQVYNKLYISSDTRFNHFEYGNIFYKYINSKMSEGIIQAKNTIGVRITDLERTVVDSISDINKISGLEELFNCIEGIHTLDETKLRRYLDLYKTQGLYQKVGYLLSRFKDDLRLSEDFFNYCKSKIGNSRRYLVSDTKAYSYYNHDWKLMVPKEYVE